MSEKQEFATVSQYINHLEESGEETVAVNEVVEILKEVVARPVSVTRRGKLAGLTLEDMNDEQLKREITNAKSVLYKATQRGAALETLEINQARVDAAEAEKAKRAPVKTEDEASTEGDAPATEEASDDVYSDEDLEI